MPAFSAGVPHFVEYLYVNASEGTASGGHAAIKFGDEVFHFQHVPPGLLRASREHFARFRRQYGDLENRTIHLHRVEVSEETYRLLRENFNRRLLIQDEQFERREALDRDRRLLELFHRRSIKGEVCGSARNGLPGRAGVGAEGKMYTASADLSGSSQVAEMAESPLQARCVDAPDGRDGLASAPLRLELKGVGLFLHDGWDVAMAGDAGRRQPADASLLAFRKRVEEQYGLHFLRAKSHEIQERLHNLQLGEPVPTSLSEDSFLPAAYSLAERYADLMTALVALQILDRGLALRTDALRRPLYPEFRLAQDELTKLRRFKSELEAGLLRLVESDRPDWGFPLLVGMARLIALEVSIASGGLAVLDVLPGPTQAGEDSSEDGLRQALFDEARRNFSTEKAALKGEGALDERAYSRIEQASSVFSEFRSAMQQDRPFRSLVAGGMPVKSAIVEPYLPRLAAPQLLAHFGKLKAYSEAYEAQLLGLYRYDLITRNCVSEIFRIIDTALAAHRPARGPIDAPTADEVESRVRAESIRRLGGYVDRRSLNFIPFVSFQAVGGTWRIAKTLELPSYRRRCLRQAYIAENPVLVALRESNVLSSSLYGWQGQDAAFVFFTDDNLWARPLAGSVNAIVALGQGVIGLLALPWDSGQNLRQGFKGLFLSVPELFFFNIRKGSYLDLPATHPTGEAIPL